MKDPKRRIKGLPFENRLIFTAYFTYGYPSVEESLEIMRLLFECGVDVLEVGYPFSDPVADGPTIQKAVTIALEQHLRLEKCLDDIAGIREKFPDKPIYLMTYLNPLYQRGFDVFALHAAQTGLDGVIIPDLPYESSAPIKDVLNDHQLGLVYLVSNNLDEQKLSKIAGDSDDFVYAISTLGVTGERNTLDPRLEGFLNTLQSISQQPIFVGFGISRPSHIVQLHRRCHGVIVGSALIRLVMEHPGEYMDHLKSWLQSMLEACRLK